jgi:hypothetical protein
MEGSPWAKSQSTGDQDFSASATSTNYYLVRHDVEIDQLIPLLRPNKNLKML